MLRAAMETMHYYKAHVNLDFRTLLFCIWGGGGGGASLNDLAHMRNCPGMKGRFN